MGVKITEKQFRAFLDGDEKVFALIINNESRRLFTHVHRFVKSKFDAEEIGQDIFLELWRKRPGFTTPSDIYGYIYSRATYKSLDFLKRTIPSTVDVTDYLGKIEELTPDVESQYEANELNTYLSIAVESMPEQRKKVFKMSRIEGLKRSEIAEKLNLSPQTVTNHINDALKELKKILAILILFMHSNG